MAKPMLYGLALILLVIGAIILFRLFSSSQPATPTTRITVGANTYAVYVVTSLEEQAKGLSGWKKLESGQGMLFTYPEPRQAAFWMKGMLFPIDIIWIRQGRVVGITPDAQPDPSIMPKIYNSPGPVDMVLEVLAGAADADGLRVGDSVKVVY